MNNSQRYNLLINSECVCRLRSISRPLFLIFSFSLIMCCDTIESFEGTCVYVCTFCDPLTPVPPSPSLLSLSPVQCLCVLMKLLHCVSESCSESLMDASNLAIVLAPNIIRPNISFISPAQGGNPLKIPTGTWDSTQNWHAVIAIRCIIKNLVESQFCIIIKFNQNLAVGVSRAVDISTPICVH